MYCSVCIFITFDGRIARPAHLSSAAVAEGLLGESAAALDVPLPLHERGDLSLQDLHTGQREDSEDRTEGSEKVGRGGRNED